MDDIGVTTRGGVQVFDEWLLAITKATFLEDRTYVRGVYSPGLSADPHSGGVAARHFFVFIGLG